MSLGATTYTAVTWTNGDTITEAKLDNMVANDQAYDSHAAEGILLNNNVGFYQKDSGGTNREIMNLLSTDILKLGNSSIDDTQIISKSKFSAFRSSAQAVANSVWTTIVFDSEIGDPGADFDTTNGQYTIPYDGWYLFTGTVAWSGVGTTAILQTRILNQTDNEFISYLYDIAANNTVQSLSGTEKLSAGEVVVLDGWQNTGSSKNVSGSATHATRFTGHLLSVD